MVVQPFVVIVEEVEILPWGRRRYPVDDRTNLAFVPILSFSRPKQVHMQGVQYQAGLKDGEHCLIAAPTSRAGHRRLQAENRNIEQFAFADPRERILLLAVSKRVVDLSSHRLPHVRYPAWHITTKLSRRGGTGELHVWIAYMPPRSAAAAGSASLSV